MFRRILFHLALWVAYAAVEFVANLPHYSDRRELLFHTLWFLPVIALPFYFVAYCLVPRLLWRGRKVLFGLACTAVFLFVMILRLEWEHWYWLIFGDQEIRLPLTKVSKNLFRDYSVIALGVCLKIIRDWDRKDRLTHRLQTEKRTAELQFLRAQIHPHFLFNTLNNLYGLALKNSPNTPESILKVSGLLDFILYECDAERIPLRKETDLIERFIAVEKLRYSPEMLRLECRYDPVPETAMIAPLLLLPFVENAFKHGGNSSDGQVQVRISLHLNGPSLHFQIENSRAAPAKPSSSGKGLGLKNVAQRLELLYPGRHQLQKIESQHTFLIALQMDLS